MKAGNQVFAIDFAADLPNNGRLIGIDEVMWLNNTDEGIVISDDDEDLGVDRTLAKFRAQLIDEGEYPFLCTVSFDDGDGGGSTTALVTLIVKEAS